MVEPAGKILVAATGKGGAGKSTTVACLASYWHAAGRKVALIDADANQTLTRWHSKGGKLSEITLRTQHDDHAIIPTAAELAAGHEIVLIDCAGFSNQAMVFAIGAADFVLIPVMTDEANVFEALRTRKIVQSASMLTKRTIPARTLLTRVKRSSIATHARNQLVQLQAEPLETQISDRVIFQEATFHGSSPTALEPGGAAAADIERLAREIEPLLWPQMPVNGHAPEPAAPAVEVHEPKMKGL
jgi:chromosome partitioning protein